MSWIKALNVSQTLATFKVPDRENGRQRRLSYHALVGGRIVLDIVRGNYDFVVEAVRIAPTKTDNRSWAISAVHFKGMPLL